MTMIRSTFFGRLNALSANLSSLGAQYGRVSEMAATGVAVSRASDAPELMGRIHKVKAEAADQEVWQENSTYAESILSVADNALQGMADVLSQGRELAVQLSSETYSPSDLTANAAFSDSMLEEMSQFANASFGDRFIFAGDDWDSEAYDPTGNYLGTAGDPEILVADDWWVQVGFDGSDLLQGTSGDVFAAFQSLSTALSAGDHTLVQATLDDFDTALTQLTSAMTRVGTEQRASQDAGDLASSMRIAFAGELSNMVDADLAETYTMLSQLQTSYEAAISVSAAAKMGTLFDRI
jgi:flagellar hook-associated protein 3 FlgL